jgi:S1-C subfamily serine protease
MAVRWRGLVAVAVWAIAASAAGAGVADAPRTAARAGRPPSPPPPPKSRDDLTFRPTVLIRKGTSQGSGTVIASVDGETLILTAAHVVKGSGELWVELHRYNLGVEHAATSGAWPRRLRAEVAASDRAADLAVVRIRKMTALPYVARLALGDGEPPPGTAVTSVGIDLGTNLSSWVTRIEGVLRLEMEEGLGDRPFLRTQKLPEHGRSGGGLFRAGGIVVGVCVGRAEFQKKWRFGVFASSESIRRLLHENHLLAAVARSDARRDLRRRAGSIGRSEITPTRSSGTR